MAEKLKHNQVSVCRYIRSLHLSDAWFGRIIDCAATSARKPPRRVQIILVGDARMAELNYAYRGRRGPTDVLSFPARDAVSAHWPAHIRTQSDDEGYIGEILLDIPHLRRQARSYAVPFSSEAARMTIHGFFHLWGYDHIRARDARIMMPLQNGALRRAEIIHLIPPYAIE